MSDFPTSDPISFLGSGEYNLLFNVYIVKLLLKKNGGETEGLIFFIFVVQKALIVNRWVVVTWGRTSYLGPTEVSSFVYLV